MTANEYGVMWWADEKYSGIGDGWLHNLVDIQKLSTVHFKRVNFMTSELYLNSIFKNSIRKIIGS